MSSLWTTVCLFLSTSSIHGILAIEDIPTHYISTKPMKSLFCNACSVLSSIVNDTLYDNSTDFESLVGFRLDSTGKKIRKQSGWLKLFLSLEDVCDDWKDQYRTAKRKNGYLYLIENEMVRAFEQIERKRKQKLETEASDRLHKQWDEEWEIEKTEKDRIYNETHDEFGNLIEVNATNQDTEAEQTENEAQDTETDEGDSDDAVEDDEEDSDAEGEDDEKASDEAVTPRYFREKKPKLVKKKSKQHKVAKEMCYFLNEQLDEWLHTQQKVIPKQMKEGEPLHEYLKPLSFCLEGAICKKAMFDTTPKIFKFKKELKLPKKPKRTWQPPIQVVEEEYEEEMEDDVDEVEEEKEKDDDDDVEMDPIIEDGSEDKDDKPKSEL